MPHRSRNIMKILPQSIFSEFKNKVLNPLYVPALPFDILKARLTATSLLQDPDNDIVKHAESFIHKTSCYKEQDLTRLGQLAAQVKSWDLLEICSIYTNITGTFLEYKLSFTTRDDSKKNMHCHARYDIKEKLAYFVSQTAPLIRVTGDPVLQKPGILFPENATVAQRQELADQIEHAKSLLIQTGGAGIAANQCAAIDKPYRFTIVGVFHNIAEHALGVQRRYPGTQFPEAMIMVNPVITTRSKATQNFNHACLSVPCANRCAVVSPMEINVNYQDPLEDLHRKEVTLSGVDAVVLWHELTHIIDGKTYMDITFETIPKEDLVQFQQMLDHEIQRRQEPVYDEVPELTVPPFYFSVKINAGGVPRLDAKELADVLPKMTADTLSGLFNQAHASLKKKSLILNPALSSISVFLPKKDNLPAKEYQAGFTSSKL